MRWLNNPAAQETQLSICKNSYFEFITGERTIEKTNLSMTCHGLTRSKELVNIHHRSLGINYTDVLDLYATLAKEEAIINEGFSLGIAKHVPATVVLDNDDFRVDTLTGGDTSHRANVILTPALLLVGTHQMIWKISQVKQLR